MLEATSTEPTKTATRVVFIIVLPFSSKQWTQVKYEATGHGMWHAANENYQRSLQNDGKNA